MARSRPAARMNRRRKGGAAAEGENSGRWHGAGRQGGRGGAPAASARRVGGTSEEVHRPLARGPVDRATEEEHRPLAQGGSAEQQRRCGRQRRSSGCERKAGQRNGGEGADGRGAPADGTPGSGTKKACAAAGPYPEVRTTLFIIGSVRRGYALQRRESSCRPT